MKTENEWISVKERLPDVLNLGDGNVCKIEAKDSEGEFDVLYGTSGAPGEPYSFFSQRNITHWRVKKTLDPMNTEQLRTAEEIATIIWASKHCGSSHVQLIENFASQESKIAVDEFKEKLKEEIKNQFYGRVSDIVKTIESIH